MNITLFLILLICLSEAIAQTCLRSARTFESKECTRLIVVGFVFYVMVAWLLYKTYGASEMGHTNLIWSCLSIIIAFVIGKVFFDEKLSRDVIIAIIFAIGAIYFAQKSEINSDLHTPV